MNKKIRIALTLMILSILIGSATLNVFAGKYECSVWWPTHTGSQKYTAMPLGGEYFDAGYVDGGIYNICKGTYPLDTTSKGIPLFSLEDACLYFHNDSPCGDDPSNFFYLDKAVLDKLGLEIEMTVVHPDNPDEEYIANDWNIFVDYDGNFTMTKYYIP